MTRRSSIYDRSSKTPACRLALVLAATCLGGCDRVAFVRNCPDIVIHLGNGFGVKTDTSASLYRQSDGRFFFGWPGQPAYQETTSAHADKFCPDFGGHTHRSGTT